MPKAISGPSAAPIVSSIRCTPKARPRCSVGVAEEIIESRGAVRTPLPMRSAATTAEMLAAPAANSRKTLATADSP